MDMCQSVDFTHYLANIDLLFALTELFLMIHDCIFMTLLNVLATPENIIKIYAKIKKLCHFNHTLIERKHKNESFLYTRYKKIRIFTVLKSQYFWI